MAGQIRIGPDAMRGRAGEYRTQAEAVNNVIAAMDALLGALQGEWAGAASVAYANRYEELKPGFVKAEELINEIADALTNTAATMEETDAAIAAAFGG